MDCIDQIHGINTTSVEAPLPRLKKTQRKKAANCFSPFGTVHAAFGLMHQQHVIIPAACSVWQEFSSSQLRTIRHIADGSRFIILFIMPDMNHALRAVPPSKEIVKSCEFVPFPPTFPSSLSFISVYLRLYFFFIFIYFFTILKFTVVSMKRRRISPFTNKTEIKMHKESDRRAHYESEMR